MGILRLLLALAVLIAHSSPFFGIESIGGPVAVESFFMISGFYMSLVLNGKYGDGSYALFITNRLLRIYPVYWVIVALTILTSGAFYVFFDLPLKLGAYQEANNYLGLEGWLLLAVANLFIIGQDLIMFLSLGKDGHLFFTNTFLKSSPPLFTLLFAPQAWSLAIEITFYLIAPFLVRRRPITLLLLCILSLAVRYTLYSQGLYEDPWSYRFFPCELIFFLLGALGYRAYEFIRNKHISIILLYALFELMIAYTVLYQFLPDHLLRQLIYYACFAISLPFIFLLTKNSKWMNQLGELSYPVYISHMLVLVTAPTFMGKLHISSRYLIYWLIIITLIFSWTLVRLVVNPIERLRQRRVAKNAVMVTQKE